VVDERHRGTDAEIAAAAIPSGHERVLSARLNPPEQVKRCSSPIKGDDGITRHGTASEGAPLRMPPIQGGLLS
jgi:hypothetical protein